MTQPTIIRPYQLLKELSELRPQQDIIDFLQVENSVFDQWKLGQLALDPIAHQRLTQYCLREELRDLLESNAVGLPSYNPYSNFTFSTLPIGYGTKTNASLSLRRVPTKICDMRVGFPFGVPASVLTGTSNWIEFYAERGFDILTYKTVRTRPWDVHPRPNLVFLPNAPTFKSPADFNIPLSADPDDITFDASVATAANSFGIPSQPPSEWQADVEKARAALSSDQILIVSVTGTTWEEDKSFEALLEDFVAAASMARDAGADLVELNLSCPNVKGHHEGDLFKYSEESASIVEKVWSKALGKGTIPLLIKIGYLEANPLKELVKATANYIAGIVAINTISVPVTMLNSDNSYFPKDVRRDIDRSTPGVSGAAIRPLAVEVVRNLVTIREQEKLDFEVLAVGGVSTPQHFQDYLDLGATAVLSCTGALIDTELAINTRLYTSNNDNAEQEPYSRSHNYVRELILMREKQSQTNEEPLPEIEPGFGWRKPPRVNISGELLDQLIRKKDKGTLRDLLHHLRKEKESEKTSK